MSHITACTESRKRQSLTRLALCMILMKAGLVGYLATAYAPTVDEPAHLAAGIQIWINDDFGVYRVNPPLVKTIAAIPALCGDAITRGEPYVAGPGFRAEWSLGQELLTENGGEDSVRLFIAARWALIPIALLGSWATWRWSTELYGEWAGLLSLILITFSPTMLAWEGTICPDAFASSVGLLAGYQFWRWLNATELKKALLAGSLLGLALLSKTTMILLLFIWPALWVLLVLKYGHMRYRHNYKHSALQLTLIIATGLLVLNAGYGFQGSLSQLKDYEFVSRLLSDEKENPETAQAGNRFRDSCLGHLVIPLPRDYVIGADLQRRDFELGKRTYLMGAWRPGSCWYYYLVAILVKVPLGTLALVVLRATLAFRKSRSSGDTFNDLCLALPAVVFFLAVSSQTGFGHHLRYALPAFPYVFVWIGKLAHGLSPVGCVRSVVISVAMLESAISSLMVYPHCIAYFNSVAQGPAEGHRVLLHSNLDWGQDLLRLKQWLDSHPQCRPISVDCISGYSVSCIGILPDDLTPPDYGWYAISKTRLLAQPKRYAELLAQEPVARVGYSVLIFRLPSKSLLPIPVADCVRLRDHQQRPFPPEY